VRELREMVCVCEACEAERASCTLLVILLVRERGGENGIIKFDWGEEERRSSIASSSSSSKAVMR
jgi:hypothetical protein